MTQAAVLSKNNLNITKRNVDRIREQWIQAVSKLMDDITQWAGDEPGWRVVYGMSEIEEEKLGVYKVPRLRIETGEQEYIDLQPFMRKSWRGNGQVQMSVYPTGLRVGLMRDETTDQWIIRTSSAIDWPFALNREVFLDVAKRLLDAP